MAGKTTIDTDLRDEVLAFLKAMSVYLSDQGFFLGTENSAELAGYLHQRLKPQRTRTRKLSKCSENEMPDFGGEPATHLQPSQ